MECYEVQGDVWSRRIEGPMAVMEQLRRDLPDAFAAAEDRYADGMIFIKTQCQIFKHTAVRIVQMHTDLLVDDADFLLYALFRKIGCGHKFQQQFQSRFKILRTGDVVGRHIIARKGIGAGAQRSKLCNA